MTEEIRRYLDKADHALLVAADLLDDGHVPDAASKIYYAFLACILPPLLFCPIFQQQAVNS